jgi:assimilatory nitrate reductase catalytic subunit
MFTRWSSPEAAFHLLRRCSSGQPCDITGISDYGMIDECGGVQWPLPSPDGSSPAAPPETERRLFADGKFFTPDQRAQFLFEAPREAPEKPDADYPITLLTGRGTSAQWHTNTRTGKSDVLRKLAPASIYVEIHPSDAEKHRIESGDAVQITSRRATIKATAFVTSTVLPGQIFLPMHYEAVNRLTYAAFDPYSRQPSYKACAVKISSAAE